MCTQARQTVTAIEGETVELECQVDANPPNVTFFWLFNNTVDSTRFRENEVRYLFKDENEVRYLFNNENEVRFLFNDENEVRFHFNDENEVRYLFNDENEVRKVSRDIIISKKGRQCKAEREWYTLGRPKTPALQYQPVDRKKRKAKKVEDYSRDRAA